MLDLQKYLRRAEADPSFRKRLLQDANRAIKDEFGEDLPYKLKFKEKLSFEAESMDGSNVEDLEGVAGGAPGPEEQTIPPGYVHLDEFNYPLDGTMRPWSITYRDDSGNRHVHDIKEINGVKYVNTQNSYVNPGNLNVEDLEGVAGGAPGPEEQTIPPGYVRWDKFEFDTENGTVCPFFIKYRDANGNLHIHDIKEINGVKYVDPQNSYVEDTGGLDDW